MVLRELSLTSDLPEEGGLDKGRLSQRGLIKYHIIMSMRLILSLSVCITGPQTLFFFQLQALERSASLSGLSAYLPVHQQIAGNRHVDAPSAPDLRCFFVWGFRRGGLHFQSFSQIKQRHKLPSAHRPAAHRVGRRNADVLASSLCRLCFHVPLLRWLGPTGQQSLHWALTPPPLATPQQNPHGRRVRGGRMLKRSE